MKQRIRRHLAWLLACAMLPMTACSDNAAQETTANTPAETASMADSGESTAIVPAETALLPDIPMEGDFGGETVRFIHWSGWPGTVRWCRDIAVEGLTGEAINDTVFNRNLEMESRYKVSIAVDIVDLSKLNGEVAKLVQAGDETYDVVMPILLYMNELQTKGYLYNLHDMPHMDLTKPWWDQNSVQSITFDNYLPAVSSSLSVNDKDATAAMAFNKILAINYSFPNLYDMVREGKWTFDTVATLGAQASDDLDGDGDIDEYDLYGFLGGNDVSYAYYFASGERMITQNEDGGMQFAFGGERSINVMMKINELMHQNWFFNHHEASNPDDGYYQQLFETGHGTFFWMRLDAVTDMREGDADFGVLPSPKYTEEQDNYYSIVSPYTTGILSIPITLKGEKRDHVGIVLEAMAAYSHDTLIPEYIETSLKTKHARDAESAEMLDIILSNRVFDPMMFYNFGGVRDSLLTWGANDNLNLASTLRATQKVVLRSMENFVEELAEARAANAE